jgi:hypothetical protein
MGPFLLWMMYFKGGYANPAMHLPGGGPMVREVAELSRPPIVARTLQAIGVMNVV